MDNKENNTPLSGERVPQVRTPNEMISAKSMGFSPIGRKMVTSLMEEWHIQQSIHLQSRIAELESENSKLREALGSLKQFLYNEIIERRNYSASKSFEIVLEQIDIFEQALKGKEVKDE